AMILDGVITARAALKGQPDREAIAAARRELREARWCFKVFRKAMGPAYPARAARLQAASRAKDTASPSQRRSSASAAAESSARAAGSGACSTARRRA
ncbi:UNVERIFIED_CONTAM: hypothetical protein NY603_20145, partial [Bacteroidetes bacterium 56_B9]